MGKSNSRWSSSQIEKLYRKEKARIESSAQLLEKEKLKAYLRLLEKSKRFLQGRMNKRMHAVRRLNIQLKKKQNQLLKRTEKLRSLNGKDSRSLQAMETERKKLLSELKNLGSKKK